jgi:hypothetical protein
MNKIAVLNDELRRMLATSARGNGNPGGHHRLVSEEQLTQVLDQVRRFGELTNDNDPHHERHQRRLYHGTRRRRIGDQRAAETVRGRAEIQCALR